MKTKLFFVLTLLSAVLNSCKKSEPTEPAETVYKIKTVRSNLSGATTTYEYNAEGRISAEQYSSGQKVTYAYTPGMVTINEYNSSGTVTYTYYLDLNGEGFVVRSYTIPSNGFDEIYTYNASKELVTFVSTGNGNPYTTTYYYTNSQLDSTRQSSNAGLEKRTMYEYESAIHNTIHTDINWPGFFMPRQSVKAIKKLTIYHYNPSTGALLNTQVNNYTYETDMQGRITRKILNYGNGNISGDVSYTYY